MIVERRRDAPHTTFAAPELFELPLAILRKPIRWVRDYGMDRRRLARR
jgi:hypothetical protein